MIRVLAVVACGLSLAACSSWLPSFDLPGFRSGPAMTTLRIESDPPGAEAKVPGSEPCRTPCAVSVPVTGDFIVNLSLDGYQPQSVTVRPVAAVAGASESGGLEPNPVYGELKPVAPPAKKRPPRRPRPRGAATAATQSQPAAQPAAPAPVPAAPWPAPR